jgi:hypothetical protein
VVLWISVFVMFVLVGVSRGRVYIHCYVVRFMMFSPFPFALCCTLFIR